MVVPYLRRKWLKLITLRIWDDDHVDQREKTKRDVFFDTSDPRMEIPAEDVVNTMPKAWKSATRLDYRDERLDKAPVDWFFPFTTFRSIQLLDVTWEDFSSSIFFALEKFPPRHRCTISVENELNLKEIKWYFSNDDSWDLSSGYRDFESDTGRRKIIVRLKNRKIIIDTERVPGQQLDDRDPAHASSDESWTES